MLKFLKNFWNDEKGQSMSEYGLILALVAVVAIATLTVLGTNIMEMFQNIADSIAQ
ncbi:Flp family type IVb pilin [Geomicrobium sediminis]|uniref:Pilus assembly protein Flp/PilA n=1 Tax=Geomicrobium sediminis TaxID=1347788 RepID=A0ABS2PG08_9BACL|nr:Flp family type IVb pilin [Geomicrobium sediminis]MBM7634369.1 pilus assembly protein Flp/PilA [Geomicrobium sediminis]